MKKPSKEDLIRAIVIEIMNYDWNGVNKYNVNGVINHFVDKIYNQICKNTSSAKDNFIAFLLGIIVFMIVVLYLTGFNI
jgi:hypothetical protein